MKWGFGVDEEDVFEKLQIRICGFDIISICGGRSWGFMTFGLLGFWFEINFK